MKLYAPSYYKSFKCVGGDCERSCCIGWEIDIDKKTLEGYRTGKGEVYDRIRATVSTDASGAHFRLVDGERCPHLNPDGLCDIIIALGEGALCHICREHPRYYNPLSCSVEVGVGLACPEAARLILSDCDFSICEAGGAIPEGIYPIEDAEVPEWIYGELFAYISGMLRGGESVEKTLSALIHLGLWADDAQCYSYHSVSPADSFAILPLDTLIGDYISIIEESFPSLEALDDRLIPRILAATENIANSPDALFRSLSGDGRLDFFRLLFYFTHRYLAPAMYDARWAERLLLSATLSLSLYFLSFSEGTPLVDTAVDFSASIEYSSENIERLLDYLSERFF